MAFAMVASGCRDELPTITGADRFPQGIVPLTIEYVVPADEIVTHAAVHGGYTTRNDADFRLVARRFDGVLDAHTLARFTNFPDSVMYPAVEGPSHTDLDFTYVGGRIFTTVIDTFTVAPDPVDIELWTLTQGWEPGGVSWELAVDEPDGARIPWQVPGGTRGELLSRFSWSASDTTAARDSVSLEVDGETIARMATGELAGFAVALGSDGSRMQVTPLRLEVDIVPTSRADTILTRTISRDADTFIFSPEPPRPAGVLRVGGVESARTVLRLRLDRAVPTCPQPEQVPDCPRVPLREVTLNAIRLELEPLPVPDGYRPVRQMLVGIRQVLEPELGRRAPLGRAITRDTVPASHFQAPGAPFVPFLITGPVFQALQRGESEIAVALLVEPDAATFAYAWFGATPRVRFIYTLRQPPQLP
jgi:hypothetical protein